MGYKLPSSRQLAQGSTGILRVHKKDSSRINITQKWNGKITARLSEGGRVLLPPPGKTNQSHGMSSRSSPGAAGGLIDWASAAARKLACVVGWAALYAFLRGFLIDGPMQRCAMRLSDGPAVPLSFFQMPT